MSASVYILRSFFFFQFSPMILSYKISTVDSPGVCNETIYLEEGAKSAAILRLTSKDSYDFTPMNCIITFKASKHSWSGLTGVLEEVDLRRYESNGDHHLDQSQCIDYIKVFNSIDTSGIPKDEQCGSWSISPAENLSHIGFRRSLFGYCPNPPAPSSAIRCGVSELKVQVSVGQRDYSNLRRGKPWRSYRGFTFVVTAYSYSYGEKGCTEGLQSCGKMDYHGYQHHCIHKSLWCDHHINCGQPKNYDELMCHNDEMLSGLVTVMVGPWVGAALLVVLVLAGVLYWRRARPPPVQGPPQPQDHNSYAESYEVSSTMSSAHHMAIQVRVVCNSGHGIHTPRTSPWQAADLPPSYESLFPQGPPPSLKSTLTTTTTSTTTASSAASFNISTTSLVSATIGSNPNASSGPSGFYSNTTQTSSIVIPINALCNPLGNPTAMSSTSFSTTTFTNTVTSAAPTATNTTTSTTTIASVGPSPSAMASISVTSVSHAGPPRDAKSAQGKDNTDTLNPHQGTSSRHSSRAASPNSCPKTDSKGNLNYMAEVTPPLVEPEDTNISPCNSAGDTPASADTQLPYSFQEAALGNAQICHRHNESLSMPSCNSPVRSPRHGNTKQEMEAMSLPIEATTMMDRSSNYCAGNEKTDHYCGKSHIPNHRPDDLRLEDREVSTSLYSEAEEDESRTEFNSLPCYMGSADYNEGQEITEFQMAKEDEEDLDYASDKDQDMDRDDESLL